MGLHMSHETSCFPATAPSTAALRDERIWLLARHDSGAITPAVFKVVRTIEIDIAWTEYREALQ